MHRAYTYLTGVKQALYYENSQIMKWDAFVDILELYFYGESKNLQQFTLLELSAKGKTEEDMQTGVRKTDYLGKKDDEHYYAILSNTMEEEAQNVLERYKQFAVPAEIITKKKGISVEEAFPSVIQRVGGENKHE